MALFSKKKKEAATESKEMKVKETAAAKKTGTIAMGEFIISPRVTERTTDLAGAGVYVFNVTPKANKALIKKEIEALYKVIPTAVHIVNAPTKAVSFRGISGKRGGGKKAFVYVKKADRGKINFT